MYYSKSCGGNVTINGTLCGIKWDACHKIRLSLKGSVVMNWVPNYENLCRLLYDKWIQVIVPESMSHPYVGNETVEGI